MSTDSNGQYHFMQPTIISNIRLYQTMKQRAIIESSPSSKDKASRFSTELSEQEAQALLSHTPAVELAKGFQKKSDGKDVSITLWADDINVTCAGTLKRCTVEAREGAVEHCWMCDKL